MVAFRAYSPLKGLQIEEPLSSSLSSSSSSSKNCRVRVRKGLHGPCGNSFCGGGGGERKPVMASTTESLLVEERQAEKSVDLKPIVEEFAGRLVKVMRNLNGKASRFRAQRFVERAIIDCRFFTLIGVAGSLLGSILCFLEGVFLVLESFVEYFKVVMWRRSDEGQMVLLLMEAIDMFFVGTAMLIFGMALHELFIRSKDINTENESSMSSSNLFGRFHLKGRPAWMEMGSVGDAKTKIGQAVVMVLQVGVLEKGKKVQLLSGLDMACFAGAILASAACIFILSMLSSSNRGPIRWWK